MDNTRATALKRAYSRLKQQRQHRQHRQLQQHQQRRTPLHQASLSSPLVSSLWTLSSLTSLVVSLGSLFSPSSRLLVSSCSPMFSLSLSLSLPLPLPAPSTWFNLRSAASLGPLSPSLRHRVSRFRHRASSRVSLVLCATCLPCGSLVSYVSEARCREAG